MTLCVCVSVCPPSREFTPHYSGGGEGNALYPVLSSFVHATFVFLRFLRINVFILSNNNFFSPRLQGDGRGDWLATVT